MLSLQRIEFVSLWLHAALKPRKYMPMTIGELTAPHWGQFLALIEGGSSHNALFLATSIKLQLFIIDPLF